MLKLSQLVQNIKDVIITPAKFWEKSKSPEFSNNLFAQYYLTLVLIATLAVFLGAWFGSPNFYIRFAIVKTLCELLVFILQYYISVYLVNELITSFGGKKNLPASRKLVVFSLTPILLVSIITGLFLVLYVVDVLGLYSIYIFWLGVKELLNLPENKESGYVLITSLLNLFVYGFLSIFLWKIFVSFV